MSGSAPSPVQLRLALVGTLRCGLVLATAIGEVASQARNG
jgi:hypothetical protein